MASPAADVTKTPREGGQVASNRVGSRLQVEDKQKTPFFNKRGFTNKFKRARLALRLSKQLLIRGFNGLFISFMRHHLLD